MSHVEGTARILMCPPDHYGIEYEINAWMSRARQADPEVAARQWNDLRSAITDAGAEATTMTPVEGLPDLVFTANAALIFRRTAVLARFRHDERQREVEHDRRWLEQDGFEARTLSDEYFFEGAGDALFCGDTLFAGYRLRSDALGHQELGSQLGVRVIPMELIDPYYYHLDTCFCPLRQGTAIYYPPAFDDYGRQALAEHVAELIPVEESEARRFACNAVVIGETVITNTGCPVLRGKLNALGFATVETPLDEFTKAGGSAKCLTLRLDGEDAASWKHETESD
ncbi:MAG: arginine deiminase-related protein [Planctomycetales bacterium]